MSLDVATISCLFLVFVRISAALLASPLFGGHTPVQIRIMLCGALAMCVAPAVQPMMPGPPRDLVEFTTQVMGEAGMGLVLGMCLQAVIVAAQMAGSVMDVQIGLASMQVFNPLSQHQVTLFSNLKTWLALVLLVIMNGHHVLITALISSYHLQPDFTLAFSSLTVILGKMSLLALQLAAPPTAVALLIDFAAGFVNKAVPQMQVYLVTMPAKMIMGVTAVSVALPILVSGVTVGVEHAFDTVGMMMHAKEAPAHGR